MAELANYPFVNQLNSPTLDGRADENKWFNCVICSILSAMLFWKPELRGKITPDSIKDAVLGEGYQNKGTDAHWFVPYVATYGLKLYPIECQPGQVTQEAHRLIENGKPAIFTEIDPYVNTSLPQYAGWTHVCSFFKEISGGLTAMDPFGGKLVEKSDAAWSSVIVGKELWTIELEDIQVEIAYNTPGVKAYFTETAPNIWLCLQTGKVIRDGMLVAYKKYGNKYLCGLTYAGIPMGNEIPIENIKPPDNPTKYQHLAGKGITVQPFECLDLVYDPAHLLDKRPGMDESVYPAHIIDGVGLDLLLAIEKVPTPVPPPPPPIQGIDPTHVKSFQADLEVQAHDLVAKAQELASAIIVPVV